MGGILGSSGTNAKQSRAVGSLQFQTSQRGGVIPLMYGNNRLAPNLLDYDDFKATASSASGGKGGKGGGGGKGGSQQYMYSASFILGLCQGPIANIGTTWADKNVGVIETAPASYINILFGTDGQAVDSFWETNHPAKAISYSGTAAVVLGIYQLGNTATLPNFSFEIVSAFTDGPNGTDANPASVVTDFLTNLRYGANFPSANLDTLALWRSYCQALGIALSPKIDTLQAANTYLDSIVKLTNSAIVWSGNLLKILPYGDMPVTNSFTIANFTGGPTQAGGDTIALTVTDPALNGGTPVTATYTTLANQQMPAAMAGLAGAINALSVLTNFGIYAGNASAFSMMIVQGNPTGNTSFAATGGGGIGTAPFGGPTTYTFTPVTQPIYSLSENDYIVQESSVGSFTGPNPGGDSLRAGATPITGGFSDDPLHIVRSTPADANNMIEVQCVDRGDSYNSSMAEAFDQASIDLYGIRRDTSVRGDAITDPYYVGSIVAQLMLQRSIFYRSTYTFNLGWKYALLEPMDLVQITDTRMGANALTVRITAVEEDDEGLLTVTAEDFFGAYSPAVLYPPANYVPQPTPTVLGFGGGTAAPANKQAGGTAAGGGPPTWNSNPGNINPPIIFEPPAALLTGDLEIWFALSGGPNWGGAEVTVASSAAGPYGNVGPVNGNSVMGFLTASLPTFGGSNPDTAGTLAVDLSESRGQLASVTTQDAANFISLCYVDGELMSYKTATPTAGTDHYNLTTLYRGAYGSTVGAHAAGSNFALLSPQVGRFAYPSSWIGSTVYFQFLSFNQTGGGQQASGSVTTYPYTITGAGVAALTIAIAGSEAGAMGDAQILQTYVFAGSYTFPIGMEGSFGHAGTAANSAATFSIKKNGSTVGTMVFAASPATTATFTMASPTSFAAGDALTVVAPATHDTALANVGWTLIATS